jgi:hypothetical protein
MHRCRCRDVERIVQTKDMGVQTVYTMMILLCSFSVIPSRWLSGSYSAFSCSVEGSTPVLTGTSGHNLGELGGRALFFCAAARRIHFLPQGLASLACCNETTTHITSKEFLGYDLDDARHVL